MTTTMQEELQRRAPQLFDPMLLHTPDGCDEAEKSLGAERIRLNNAIQILERRSRLTPDEHAQLQRYRNDVAELVHIRRAIKDRKSFLLEDRHLTFERAYVQMAKENLPRDLHDALVQLAKARVEEAKARTVITNTVGSAIGVIGAAAGPKVRRA